MKYIINGTVQFLVAERKLTGNGGVEVILSNPACRLLIVFLEHNHQQVSREILLEKVWEDFGLVSSESSLNNSISSLRRGLRDVGIDNTIEHGGFRALNKGSIDSASAVIILESYFEQGF